MGPSGEFSSNTFEGGRIEAYALERSWRYRWRCRTDWNAHWQEVAPMVLVIRQRFVIFYLGYSKLLRSSHAQNARNASCNLYTCFVLRCRGGLISRYPQLSNSRLCLLPTSLNLLIAYFSHISAWLVSLTTPHY
jgi:hypothetical protein